MYVFAQDGLALPQRSKCRASFDEMERPLGVD
jgi:hypothetical protein